MTIEWTKNQPRQIVNAKGPSGPNRDYLFNLEKQLLEMGCEDEHVTKIANEARKLISAAEDQNHQAPN